LGKSVACVQLFLSTNLFAGNKNFRRQHIRDNLMIKQTYFAIRRIILGILSIVLFRLRLKPFLPETVKTIFLFADYRIGDTILAMSAIRALKKRFPSASVTAMVKENCAALWRLVPEVNKVCDFRRTDSYIKKLGKAIGLRKSKFDLAIDLTIDHTMLGVLAVWLSGAKFRIGYDIEGRGLLFNRPIARRLRTMHFMEEIADLVRAAGAEPTDPTPRFTPSADARTKAQALLIDSGVNPRAIVGIHAGGTYPTQRWLVERFAAVADRLIEQHDMHILLFGNGAEEKKLLDTLTSHMKLKPLQIVDQPIDVIAAAIQQCRAMVCNNSGLLHLSAAVGVPTVSFMGPTVAHRWWPAGQGHIVLRKNIPCIGCNSGRCLIKTFDCMKLITVDEVMENVIKILKQNSDSGSPDFTSG
jgi:ADP-heptose:LPS heptosyltransferase